MEYIRQQQYPHEVISTANISDLMGDNDRRILSTGNTEPDNKIADGLPLESLTLIEGENDSVAPDPIWLQVTTSNGVNAQTTYP